MLTDNSSYYFYNILNKVNIPSTLDEGLLDKITLTRKMPWTTLSHNLYGTMYLWWLIFIINSPDNIFVADAGVEFKYIKPEYIDMVLTSIEQQLNI